MPENNKVSGFSHLQDPDAALYVQALLEDNLSVLETHHLQHVEECSGCKEKILEVYLAMADRKKITNRQGERVSAPPFSFVTKTRRLFLPLVAATLVAFVVLLTVYRLLLKPSASQLVPVKTPIYKIRANQVLRAVDPAKKTKIGKPDSFNTTRVPKTDAKQAAPKKFRVNTNLEAMVNSHTRSAVWQILSPVNDVFYQGLLKFSWKQVAVKPLKLKILNNLNTILFTFEVTGKGFLFSKSLPAGLYYWKLESSDDLLHVVRFRVLKRVSAPLK